MLDDDKATRTWVVLIDDSPGSLLVLTKAKGVITGFANYKDQTLEIVPAAGGKHLLYEVDTKQDGHGRRHHPADDRRPG